MQSLSLLLQEQSIPAVALSALFGLLMGSFLNVIIYRLPLMIQRESTDPKNTEQGKHFNLAWPGSHCPQCYTPISPRHNIPLFSYLRLKGRCYYCHSKISCQYPLVELAAALLSATSTWVYGASPQAAVYIAVSLTLLTLAVIDLNTLLLPDKLTLPLLWAGLLYQSIFHPAQLTLAVWGATLGYLVFWSIYWLFRLLTGKEGMGYGDFKLMAALGAWLGADQLPAVMLISALSGLLIGVIYKLTRNTDTQQTVIPFGPALALAGWLCLIFPDTVHNAMIRLFF